MNFLSRNRFLIVVIIYLLSITLRIYHLDKIPVSLSWDEAAIGYNAYSILQTGKDEYGEKYPVLFKSFNDYKLPGIIYLTAVSEKIFGLNDFSVRFPSALLGSLTVLAFYILLLELNLFPFNFSILAIFLLAISPWHIQFSRGAYEANGSLFFLVFGIALLLKGRKSPWTSVLGLICLCLSLYFYYTVRVLMPLLLVSGFVIFRKEYYRSVRWLTIGFIFSILIFIPLSTKIFTLGTTRVRQVSILEDQSATIPYAQALARHSGNLWAKLIYNRRVGFAYSFMKNYFRNNSIEFLFVSNDSYPKHHVVGMGYLYLWELPFFLTGLLKMFKANTRSSKFILLWWIFGAVPASFTTGSPHGLRTLTTLPAFIIFTVYGIFITWQKMSPFVKRVARLGLTAVIFLFFSVYLVYYYDFTPWVIGRDWSDGHKQLFREIVSLQNKYDQVLISGTYFKPYIYALYYLKYDPNHYQKEKGSERGFSNLLFFPADWESKGKSLVQTIPTVKEGKKTLFVFVAEEKQEKFKTINVIHDSFGRDAFYLQEF